MWCTYSFRLVLKFKVVKIFYVQLVIQEESLYLFDKESLSNLSEYVIVHYISHIFGWSLTTCNHYDSLG